MFVAVTVFTLEIDLFLRHFLITKSITMVLCM